MNVEEEICGGCDTMINADGCECRLVSCCSCGYRDHIYNMEHPLKDDEDWNTIPFSEKVFDFQCSRCFRDGTDDVKEYLSSDDEQ